MIQHIRSCLSLLFPNPLLPFYLLFFFRLTASAPLFLFRFTFSPVSFGVLCRCIWFRVMHVAAST